MDRGLVGVSISNLQITINSLGTTNTNDYLQRDESIIPSSFYQWGTTGTDRYINQNTYTYLNSSGNNSLILFKDSVNSNYSFVSFCRYTYTI